MKALTKDKTGRALNKQPNRDKAVARFVETIDYKRLELILEADPRYIQLYNYMKDPLVFCSGKGRMSFAALLTKVNVSLAEIQQKYMIGSKQLGLLEVANQFPSIASSVAENAQNRNENCPRCDGSGSITVSAASNDADADLDRGQCPSCKGSGTFRVMGDKHAIDTVGKWLELDNAKGITINNMLSQNANFGGGDDRIEDLLSKTAQVINVEAIEVEADEN